MSIAIFFASEAISRMNDQLVVWVIQYSPDFVTDIASVLKTGDTLKDF
jgi:hypothetical protein